jgi:outer membrane protein assembly factor BamB
VKRQFLLPFLHLIALIGGMTVAAIADDWPMWRHDAARSAKSSEILPENLSLQWAREYPPLRPAFWQIRQDRLQFDAGYEPVIAGGTMFVASSHNDSVTALDTETGEERWRYYADGPVRLAPVAWEQKLYFTSDDGCLYCLEAPTGKLLWKVHATPSSRKVLGNGRLISVWPARGGPVVHDGHVFFAAGVWPFEGIFVHAVDARTGKVVWTNDRTGYLYMEHPHAAMSFGGPSPQGYLMINRGRLVVPSSRSFPAFFDLKTGKLLAFDFGDGGHGSRPGGWFMTTDDKGMLTVDPQVNTEVHDVGEQTIGQRTIRRQEDEVLEEKVTIGQEDFRVQAGAGSSIRVAHREFRFKEGFPGVTGQIHTMLAANRRLFVVTREGGIYCFGGKKVDPKLYPIPTSPAASASVSSRARSLLQLTGHREGYALLWGLRESELAEDLAALSKLQMIVVDPDATKINALRRRLDSAGNYGERISAHRGNPSEFGWPPYLANLIVAGNFDESERFLETAFATLRPYGGVLCLQTSESQHATIASYLRRPAFAGAELQRTTEYSIVIRAGALPGAANYAGEPNFDDRVKAPLGLLWFGDTVHHHKLFYPGFAHEGGRGLPSFLRIEDGVMSYLIARQPLGVKRFSMSFPDYLRESVEREYADAHTDVFTGRAMSERAKFSTRSTAPTHVSAPPLTRRNPITEIEEGREYVKSHGCDLFGADYGNLITMRSGTAAFYDKRLESGMINISGMRSGCRNSIVPACGVLNVPSWTGNCTCNYPVFTSLALAPMPETYEQWSAWGDIAADAPITRMGINFGAPGDRMTDEGTLWLDAPSVGGPSPDVRVQVTPSDAQPFYRHSMWMQGGAGWPWVFASGIEGVQSVRIETVARTVNSAAGSFSVRWSGFLQSEQTETNTFHLRTDGTAHVWIDGFPVVDTTRYKAPAELPEIRGRFVLQGGRKRSIIVDYGHTTNANPAFIELNWSSPTRTKTMIPANCFYTPDDRRGGLAASYFAGESPAGAALVQIDPQVKFSWGNQMPPRLQKLAQRVTAPVRPFTIRLVFAEPEELQVGERAFAVKLQGRKVLDRFDIVKEAGGHRRGIVRQFSGIKLGDALNVEFIPLTAKPPLVCGIELIADASR